MSHFTVTVRIPASVDATGLEDALEKLLAPYQENNMGDCPQEYLKFHDAEEPELEAGETREQVMAADGYKQHPDDPNRWGYWENPNRKWDWYSLGGRWNGSLPIREGVQAIRGRAGTMGSLETDPRKSDACRIDEIDRDLLAVESRDSIDRAYTSWRTYRAGLLGETPALTGYESFDKRSSALSLGMIECISESEATEERIAGRRVHRWAHQNNGPKMVDIINDIDEATFRETFREHFYSIRTYAYLDATGWHEPGKMGWFGMSGATPETRKEHARSFMDWLNSGDQRDWIAVVDCHI